MQRTLRYRCSKGNLVTVRTILLYYTQQTLTFFIKATWCLVNNFKLKTPSCRTWTTNVLDCDLSDCLLLTAANQPTADKAIDRIIILGLHEMQADCGSSFWHACTINRTNRKKLAFPILTWWFSWRVPLQPSQHLHRCLVGVKFKVKS